MEELVKKILTYGEKAKGADGDARVEFTMLSDHYFVELIRGLPFLLCPDSKINLDIILWNEDTEDVSINGSDDRCPTEYSGGCDR